ncbi:hypothetical protein [Sorangium sp. So ce363]|uniref:hypothetical protein n=1 Tax=Sorangium sp. So ce363 TaxID=3133304 RepID=UPI003F606394
MLNATAAAMSRTKEGRGEEATRLHAWAWANQRTMASRCPAEHRDAAFRTLYKWRSETMSRIHSVVGCLFASMAAMATTGCAVEMQDEQRDEDVAEAEQAYSEPTCATVAAVATYNGGFNYTSPTTYTTTDCYKAQAVDVTNYKNGFTSQPGPGYTLHTYVTWADSLPTNEEECNALILKASLYRVVNGVMEFKAERELHGNYEDFGGCMVGPPWGIDFSTLSPNELLNGATHRIVVSARSGSWSSFPTRSFKIQTMWEP